MNGGIDNANEEEEKGDRRSKGERDEILFRNFILSIFFFFKKKAQTVNNRSSFRSLGFHNF